MTIDHRAITNDPARLEAFIAEFGKAQRPLFLYILSLTGNPTDAEDILQDTNLVLWRKFDEFQPGTSFYAWASKVAYFQVLKWRESKGRDAALLDSGVLQMLADDAAAMSQTHDSRRDALRGCLTKLRAEDRELIEQRYAPGMTGRVIAERLGRPENSVYKSIGRIRAALLKCIEHTLNEAAPERTRIVSPELSRRGEALHDPR